VKPQPTCNDTGYDERKENQSGFVKHGGKNVGEEGKKIGCQEGDE
jgi:hypothetical protein